MQPYYVISNNGWDCGPYCSPACADARHGHHVTTQQQPYDPSLGGAATCRHCGIALDDDDDDDNGD